MQIVTATGPARDFAPMGSSACGTLPVGEVVLHHLRTPAEVDNILFLRGEIDLSAHAAAGPEFDRLEKKETSAASSAVSSLAGNGSARSGSSRSVLASR